MVFLLYIMLGVFVALVAGGVFAAIFRSEHGDVSEATFFIGAIIVGAIFFINVPAPGSVQPKPAPKVPVEAREKVPEDEKLTSEQANAIVKAKEDARNVRALAAADAKAEARSDSGVRVLIEPLTINDVAVKVALQTPAPQPVPPPPVDNSWMAKR